MADYQREITITLVADAGVSFNVSGDYIHVKTLTAVVEVSRNNSGFTQMNQDETLTGSFSTFTIKSTSAQTVTIQYGTGEFKGRNVSVVGNITVAKDVPSSVLELAKVSVSPLGTVELSAANTARAALRISVLSDEVGPVFIGSSGVGANEGGPIDIGVTDYLETTGAVYAYNPHPTVAVDVYLMEVVT